MTLVALFMLAVGRPEILLHLRPPGPGISVTELAVEWRSADDSVLARQVCTVENWTIRASVPIKARSIRIAGPKWMSRVLSVQEAARRPVTLVEPALLRVRMPESATATPRMFLLRNAPGSRIEVVEGETTAGVWTATVWPDEYSVGIDIGRDRTPLLAPAVVARSAHEQFIEVTSAVGRHEVVAILEKGSGSILRDVSLGITSDPGDTDRVLLALLEARIEKPRSDGVLDLGTVTSEQLGRLLVTAPNHRAARIRREGDSSVARLARPADLNVSWPGYSALRIQGAPRLTVSRCTGFFRDACSSWKTEKTASFDDKGIVRLAACLPGKLRVAVGLCEKAEGFSTIVDFPNDSEAPDIVPLTVSLRPWRLSGRTTSSSGEGLQAEIQVATVFEAGSTTLKGSSDTLRREATDNDGYFSFDVLAPDGTLVMLAAESTDPSGRSTTPTQLTLSPDSPLGDIRIRISTGGLRVHVQEARSDKPIAACNLRLESGETASDDRRQEVFWSKTDALGIAEFVAPFGPVARVRPECDGFVSGPGTLVELAPGEMKTVTLKLDSASLIAVSVRDIGGRAVAGAKVFAAAELTPGLPETAVLLAQPQLVGGTGPDGELVVPGESFGQRPVFIVAAGYSLGVSRLPSGTDCEAIPSNCEAVIELSQPQSFAGVTLTSASGRPLSVVALRFALAGVVIPWTVTEELARANGYQDLRGLVTGTSAGNMSLIPSLFPNGVFDVALIVRAEKSGSIRSIPAGVITVPSLTILQLRALAIP